MGTISGIFVATRHPLTPNMHTPTIIRVIRWGFCASVILVILVGLFTSGSPINRRQLALDEQRVRHLTELSYALDTYVQTYTNLPMTLEGLAEAYPYLDKTVRDPVTGAFYEYTRSTTNTYELCATFDLPNEQDEQTIRLSPTKDITGNPSFLFHDSGRHCFPFRVRVYPRESPPPTPVPTPSGI